MPAMRMTTSSPPAPPLMLSVSSTMAGLPTGMLSLAGVADLVADGRERRQQVDVDRVVAAVAQDVGLAARRLDVDPVEPWAGADERLALVRAVDPERVVAAAEQDVHVLERRVGDPARHVEAGDRRAGHGAGVVVGLALVDDEQPIALVERGAHDVAG